MTEQLAGNDRHPDKRNILGLTVDEWRFFHHEKPGIDVLEGLADEYEELVRPLSAELQQAEKRFERVTQAGPRQLPGLSLQETQAQYQRERASAAAKILAAQEELDRTIRVRDRSDEIAVSRARSQQQMSQLELQFWLANTSPQNDLDTRYAHILQMGDVSDCNRLMKVAQASGDAKAVAILERLVPARLRQLREDHGNVYPDENTRHWYEAMQARHVGQRLAAEKEFRDARRRFTLANHRISSWVTADEVRTKADALGVPAPELLEAMREQGRR